MMKTSRPLAEMVREVGIAFPSRFSYVAGNRQQLHDTTTEPAPQSGGRSGKSEKPVLFATLPPVRRHGFRTSPMAAETSVPRKSGVAALVPWRGLVAGAVALAIGWAGLVHAANNIVQ